jgi:hypothetical protein
MQQTQPLSQVHENQWTKSKNLVNPSAIHHHQNPLESTHSDYVWSWRVLLSGMWRHKVRSNFIRILRATCCLIPDWLTGWLLAYSSTLNWRKCVSSSQMSVNSYQTTRRHIPVGSTLHSNCCNCKSNKFSHLTMVRHHTKGCLIAPVNCLKFLTHKLWHFRNGFYFHLEAERRR